MGNPTSIMGYEPEWILLAQKLQQDGNATLPLADTKMSGKLRRRFYGFRTAMMRHDAANPLIAVLMETQATITPEGHLHFERAPFAQLIRGMLENSVVKAPAAVPPAEGQVPAAEAHPEKHDETILSVLSKDIPPTQLK